MADVIVFGSMAFAAAFVLVWLLRPGRSESWASAAPPAGTWRPSRAPAR